MKWYNDDKQSKKLQYNNAANTSTNNSDNNEQIQTNLTFGVNNEMITGISQS